MNLDLPENLDAFVKAQVRGGRFASEQDVMAEAVRTLKSRLDQADTIEAIRQGIADVDAGRIQPWDEALAEIRRDLDLFPGS